MTTTKAPFLPLAVLLTAFLPAAAAADADDVWQVPRTADAVRIDGRVDEPAWEQAVVISLDVETQPADNQPAPMATDCLVLFDARHLYVAFRAHDPSPEQIRARLADRDTAWSDDLVGVVVDTFNDQLRAFEFFANPLGVQMDFVLDGPTNSDDASWNALWDSAGRITEDGYEVEMAIPFSSLRFPNTSGPQTWGFDAVRMVPRSSRYRLAANRRARDNECHLCQVGKLRGFEGATPGKHLEVNPTLTGNVHEARAAFPAGPFEPSDDTEAGLNVSWGVTPNVALSATLNPDFSQVEADTAQLDINTAFALFFPEKRPFFLEGAELFSTAMDAVFTRNVADPAWGLKTQGKAGRHAFSVFAAEDEVTNLLFPGAQRSSSGSFDFETTDAVARYRFDLPRTSTVGILATSREGGGYRNQVAGIDARLRFNDTDRLSIQYLSSSTEYPDAIAEAFGQPRGTFDGEAISATHVHGGERWRTWLVYEDIDGGFRADMGFMPQVGTLFYRGGVQHNWWGEEDDWYDKMLVYWSHDHKEDASGRRLEELDELFFGLQGPLQLSIDAGVRHRSSHWNGVDFDLDTFIFWTNVQPTGKLNLGFSGTFGDQIDFANTRPGDVVLLRPSVRLDLNRHLQVQANHTYQRLDVTGGTLFTANLSQWRFLYQFNLRAFLRAVFQYTDIERDPALYSFPVDERTEELFTQLLFSYKLDARTVLYLGYSDDHQGDQDVDLTQRNRTLFLKIGYAWVF